MTSHAIVLVIFIQLILPMICHGALCDPSSRTQDRTNIKLLTHYCGQTTALPNLHGVTELRLELVNSPESVPVGLFSGSQNSIVKLVLSAPNLTNPNITNLLSGTFLGLSSLVDLELIGFENIINVDADTLTPLRKLRCIYLEGIALFSGKTGTLKYLLQGLSDTPLESIRMNGVVGAPPNIMITPVWNFSEIFAIKNVSVTSLSIDNTVITSLTGFISDVLPGLTSLSISLQTPYDNFLYTLMDSLFRMKALVSTRIYGYPVALYANYNKNVFNNAGAPVIFSQIHAVNPNCLLSRMLVFSSNVTSLSIYNFTLDDITYQGWELYGKIDNRPLCFDERFKVEHLDMTNSRFPESLVTFVGLIQLKSLYLRNNGIREFANNQLFNFPKLEILALSNNDLGEMIANDLNSLTFSAGTLLKVLDLSSCNIVVIPQKEFNSLTSLQFLNLSGNGIHTTDFLIENCAQLMSLNLSNNAIEQLSENFKTQLTVILANKKRFSNSVTLEIDLSGNPLSCLCNATDFIEWIQTFKGVTFVGYSNYKCLYPDGTWPHVKDVEISELSKLCEYLNVPEKIENNTACPCEKEKLDRLYSMRYALAQYYCTYPSGLSVSMKQLDPNTFQGICTINILTSGVFLGPLVAGISVLIIITTIVVFVVVYKRKRPVEYRKLVESLECLDFSSLTGAVMRILYQRESKTPEYEYDVFVAYHNDDWLKLRNDALLSKLKNSGIRIFTENEDAIPGECRLDMLIKTITVCRYILLIISPSFATDDWCKCVAIRSVGSRLHAIIPLVYIPVELDKSELTFNNILNVCRPIYWSEEPSEQERIISDLKERLAHNFND